jgi:hypothetical protein
LIVNEKEQHQQMSGEGEDDNDDDGNDGGGNIGRRREMIPSIMKEEKSVCLKKNVKDG